jgi:voltage-gated potassium channel
LAAIAGIFLVAYSIQVLAQPQGHAKTALEVGTTIAWATFLIDYLVRLGLAANRPRWFLRHLLDLLVVALPFLRPLRLIRLLVLFGALQKAIGGAIRGRVVVYTAFSVVLLVYVASLAILETERSVPDSKITTFGDAVWWSITTVTTVGYGDLSPVSGVGRVIAVLLMIGGISLVGVVTATLASWIIQRVAEEDRTHQAVTAAEIDALRADMKQWMDDVSSQIGQSTGSVDLQEARNIDDADVESVASKRREFP